MNESWRPIRGYEGLYEVSDRGRVRRVAGGQGAMAGRVLTGKRGTAGYLHVDLSRRDVKTRFFLHRLVIEAFVGLPPSPAHVVNHRDAVKTHNTPTNLEWVTVRDNVRHAVGLGLKGGRPMPGAKNGRAKLSADQVARIRALTGQVSARELARELGVSRTAIQLIRQGKNWK